MRKTSLTAHARELLERARREASGRSSDTLVGGHEQVLRQTVVALLAGQTLGEHEGPGEATLQVLRGRVRLSAPTATWEGWEGDLLIVPTERHSVTAIEDAAFLLTVAKALRSPGP